MFIVFVNRENTFFHVFLGDTIDMETQFATMLRKIMEYRDITAKDLGRQAGIEHRTIEGWTSSRKTIPRADAAVAIAQALDTTVEYLITGEAPAGWRPPPRIEAIVDDLLILDDQELVTVRVMVHPLAEAHRTRAVSSGGG